MAKIAFFWSRKKPRSYFENSEGKRVTIGWWQQLRVEAFGEQIMRGNGMAVYKYKGVTYVLK